MQVSNAVRAVLLTTSFEILSASCVIINVLFMLTEHSDPTASFAGIIRIQNTIFLGALWTEVVLNTIGFGFGGLLNDPWKMFDVIIALGTAAGYVTNNQRLSQFANAFRLMRILKLMRMIKPIKVILETLLSTIPQLANIILLLFLVYAMFAGEFLSVTVFGVRNVSMSLYASSWRPSF